MIPLTYKENNSYKDQKVCYICKKELITDDDNYNKKYHKVTDHCHFTGKYRRAAHNICNLRYKEQKKIWLFFIMVQIMTHFIIKGLPKEFERQVKYMG